MSSDQVKYFFIINPVSGTRKGISAEILIHDVMEKSGEQYEMHVTKYKGHATELAARAVEQKIPFIVAVGGDGTLNEIAKVMTGTNSALGIIPRGSGNGLARFAKIPTDTEKALDLILKGYTQKIDTAEINGKFFISIAGSGFDAKVALHFNKSKHRGFVNYAWIAVREYFRYKPLEYSITSNGQTITRKALLISFANSDRFGYNAVIAPESRLDDGLIDICILQKPPFFSALFLLIKFFRKKIHTSRYMEILRVPSAQIISKNKIPTHIDGDTGDSEASIDIHIHPSSLTMITP
jgi:YegS/Rv2252/BmrU family lipid kinase